MNKIINWVARWIGNRPVEVTDDLDALVITTMNDFLMRPDIEAILLDINADLKLYGRITEFNRLRINRAIFEYLRESDKDDSTKSTG